MSEAIRVRKLCIRGVTVELEMPRSFDEVLDRYASAHPNDDDLIPYCADLWPSAFALAEYLCDCVSLSPGMRVIELGCGLALPSLVASLRGAEVTATDYHPEVASALERNRKRNGLCNLVYRELRWDAWEGTSSYELVLGSDLLYEARNVEPVTRCAAGLCAPAGRVILSDPGRAGLAPACRALRRHGFEETMEVKADCFVLDLQRRG